MNLFNTFGNQSPGINRPSFGKYQLQDQGKFEYGTQSKFGSTTNANI
jgi:hypothetical protein